MLCWADLYECMTYVLQHRAILQGVWVEQLTCGKNITTLKRHTCNTHKVRHKPVKIGRRGHGMQMLRKHPSGWYKYILTALKLSLLHITQLQYLHMASLASLCVPRNYTAMVNKSLSESLPTSTANHSNYTELFTQGTTFWIYSWPFTISPTVALATATSVEEMHAHTPALRLMI